MKEQDCGLFVLGLVGLLAQALPFAVVDCLWRNVAMDGSASEALRPPFLYSGMIFPSVLG